MNNNSYLAYTFDAEKHAAIVKYAKNTMNRTMKLTIARSNFIDGDDANEFGTLDSVLES